MRIAQVAPLFESVPPQGYGGTERVVSWLCDGLMALGHDVTLFASGGSRSNAKLISFRDQPLRTDPGLCSDPSDHIFMLDQVRQMADQFDIIHFHTDILHMPMFEDIAGKTVTTLHGRLDYKGLPAFYQRYNNYPLISITDYQRHALPNGNFAATIYHGLPTNTYKPNYASDQKYVAFLGRFSPEKGADRAVHIARRAGWPIRLAAKICKQIHANEVYYHDIIRPLLALPGVAYTGEIGEREKNDFLGNAKAVLFPIDWPEPFGLVMIEAMACGTPVIAFDYGSVSEVIEDGVTGFIVKNVDEAVAALDKVDQLDRKLIRKIFEQRFSTPVMARAHSVLYEKQFFGVETQNAAAILSWQRLPYTGKVREA